MKLLIVFSISIICCGFNAIGQTTNNKPNILFCIADDASYQHMSAYGITNWVKTPNFDQVAKQGLLFTRAYTPNAKCSPSRSCILTGRNPWQLEEAANHNPNFPAEFTTFMEAISEHNYFVGFTGKGWGPGDPGKVGAKERMLTGKMYNDARLVAPTKEISSVDYAKNFELFLKDKPKDEPFCFWFGSHEPHRVYEYGTGLSKTNKTINDITLVPPFWPDNDTVRTDMLDYAYEVEYFDQTLGKVLEVLKNSGELDNTLIVVTSDNGMPFPRIKGNVFEHDNHLPLAMMWKNKIVKPGRKVDDFVSFIDFAPTFLELVGLDAKTDGMQAIQGKSLTPLLLNHKAKAPHDYVLLGRERQDVGRPDDEGYPVRAIVKGNFIYAKNYEPNRWPACDPITGYMDTDGSPTKTQVLELHKSGENIKPWQYSFAKKGAEELYQLDVDPFSMNNLANDPRFAILKNKLKTEMESELKKQKDPRMFGKGEVFDNYPYSKENSIDFYNRYMKGEKLNPGWINQSDMEKLLIKF